MVSKKKLSKNFYFLSIIPAFAYWYLEENYSLEVALWGGIGLSILEIASEWGFTRKVHTLSKFNFFLIVILGAISLFFKEGVWFKLQPAFTGVGIGLFLVVRSITGKGLMIEMMEELYEHVPPEEIIKTMEIHFGALFFLYGLFMAFVAVKLSSDQWLFFKTGGFYITFFVVAIIESFIMRKKVNAWRQREMYSRAVMGSSNQDRASGPGDSSR